MLDFLQHIDESIVLFINGLNSPFLDKIMWWVSGRFNWWPLYLLLLGGLFYLKNWKQALIILGMVIILILISDQSSVHLFKNVFQRLRPSRNPELENLLHIVNDYRGGKYGFISSHAANCFGIAVLLALFFRKNWMTVTLLIWAALVSYSRIYLGVHYFFDILVGAVWGAILAYGLFWLCRKYLLKSVQKSR